MIAYACEPGRGSEPGVGWNWAREVARLGHEVHVLTRSNNASGIDLYPSEQGLHFHYHDLPVLFRRLKKVGGYFGLLGYYYFWQISAIRYARRICKVASIDVAQHVTFVNDWMPSAGAFTGVPFIWGPVGGSTHRVPPELFGQLNVQAKIFERARRSFQWLLRTCDPSVRITRRRARRILVYTDEAIEGMPRRYRNKTRAIIHIGVSPEDVPGSDATPQRPEGLVVLTGGRLVHWKGIDLLIRATALVQEQMTLVITGDGSERKSLEDLAVRCGVAPKIMFLGQLPTREDLYSWLLSADIFALMTARDGPPVGILEAMHAGKPIICFDHGATRELVPADAGYRIPLRDVDSIVRDIARCFETAATSPEDLVLRGRAARERVLARHQWPDVVAPVGALYLDVRRGLDG